MYDDSISTIAEDYLLERHYEEYINFVDVIVENYDNLQEFKISNFINQVVSFVKEISSKIGFRAKELFQMMKNKDVFSFFHHFKFNVSSVIDMMKKGYKVYVQIANFFPDLITELIVDSRTFKWSREQLQKIKEWLKRHPRIARLSGVALAGLLLVIWLNMSFVGDFVNDMDFGMIFDAIRGRFDIVDFLTGDAGVKTLVLFATGLMGISFTWFTTPVNIAIALFTTISIRYRIRLQKGKETGDIDNIAKEVL